MPHKRRRGARPGAIASLIMAVALAALALHPASAGADRPAGAAQAAPAADVVTVPTTAVPDRRPPAHPGRPIVAGPTRVVPAAPARPQSAAASGSGTSGSLRTAGATATVQAAAASDPTPPTCGGTGSDGVRVQPVYAYAGAAPDPATLAVIRAAIVNVDRTYLDSAARTGGSRQVRWVTDTGLSGCSVVIQSVPITTGTTDFDSLRADLVGQGLTNVNRKYLVWTEGTLDTPQTSGCGLGEFWQDDTPGPTNLNATNGNGGSPTFAAMDNRCWDLNGGHSVPAHELMHMLGAVQQSAPHSGYSSDPSLDAYSGHCTDDYDAMCYGPNTVVVSNCAAFEQERLFDCNNDDYFHTDPLAGSYLCLNWDTARNPYLWNSATLQPPRAVPDVSLSTTPGKVTVSWTPSPSCVAPDSYLVTVSGSGGSNTVSVPGNATSVVRPIGAGPVSATVTPVRGGVSGTTVSGTATVPAGPTVPVQAPNQNPVGEVLISQVDRRNYGLFGYAVDPDTSSPITVRVDVDGIGSTYVRADYGWDGVPQRVAGASRNHGFVYLRANMPSGTRTMCAYAIDAQTSATTQLGCRRIVVK